MIEKGERSASSTTQTSKKGQKPGKGRKPIRAHWIVLLNGGTQVAIAFWLMVRFGVTPSGTAGKLDRLVSEFSFPVDWSLGADVAIWLLMVSGLVSLTHAAVYMATTKIRIYTRSIEWQTGLIHQHAARMQFKDAESVRLYRSWIGALLNYGTVTVWGRGAGSITMEKISNAKALMQHIDKKISEQSSSGG